MKLFLADQIKNCDKITCENQNITEKDLIQRAGVAFVESLQNIGEDLSGKIIIFAGPGNNGADGISIAKNLYSKFLDVELVLVPLGKNYSDSFSFYMDTPTDQQPFPVHIIKDPKHLRDLEEAELYIDAILGTGFDKEPDKLLTAVFEYLNNAGKKIISVDIPSGISADKAEFTLAVRASKTISFEFPKLSFFDPATYEYTGEWIVAPIRLDENWIENEPSGFNWITRKDVKAIIKQRNRFAHKGDFGHSYVIAGSYGKMGAAVLTAKATLKTGAGMLTVHSPKCGYDIIQVSVPEAMAEPDAADNYVTEAVISDQFNAIAIGPGIGDQPASELMLHKILQSKSSVPLVLDADALNILSRHKEWLKLLPQGTIITPHPKEFDRLFGMESDFAVNNKKMKNLAKEHGIYIILKGGYTTITTPEGNCYFNTCGNPGMATPGSGDVLTGILTGLLSQGYTPLESCMAGVFLHGTAGDIALQKDSTESLVASDIIANLGGSF